ncbi:MAG: DUF512 domain-containing protein [Lachnospiraceae bacterium]|nr:DUF512 domain-containing protein [Lachnospiraceae bacterium]
MYEHKICRVLPGSITEELELAAGDVVVSINGQEMEDIFDYEYLCQDEYLEVLVRTAAGEEILFEVEKEEDEELGICFENGLMDEYRSCRNKCIFCFIDQMPPGMRETLYFKDDDSRLSFLQGNYVTLTNMSDRDIERIIRYHLAPINISVHTMNPELRCRMLHNRFAGEALKKLDILYEAGTEMNGQIVLCPGINDGAELESTIEKLGQYLPVMQSVSVVPVGLTRYREGLTPLEPVTREAACRTIDCIERWQKKFYVEYGTHFVHASDEFYITAGREMPEEERYDGYIQLENGVGFVRLLLTEFGAALAQEEGDTRSGILSVATGLLMAPYLERLAGEFRKKFPGVKIRIYPIRNDFFGEQITVAGLLTGQDLAAQLAQVPLGDTLLLPWNMLRNGETVFLDDMTVEELSEQLSIPIRIVQSDGADLLAAWMGQDSGVRTVAYAAYENKE